MDIKDLNKSQLILLAVLLSFVTSIATGITTVTLMQQAPVSFTEPVNRIIKQTVEKIQQVEGKTTIQTVVVKEEDLVVDAIAKNKSSVFIINNTNSDSAESFAGKGFVINNEGVIVADALWASSQNVYFVQNDSGKFKATFLFSDKGVSFLRIGEPVDGESVATYTVPVFGDLDKMKIGQKILILGGAISSFIFDGNKDIKVSFTKSNAGGLVLNLDGEALGITLHSEVVSFVPISTINESFAASLPKP